jgi:hypothetical protein
MEKVINGEDLYPNFLACVVVVGSYFWVVLITLEDFMRNKR